MSIAAMKTVSVRKFYHNACLVDGLPAGQQLVVTANGKPKFVVSNSRRPKMTRRLAEARAVGSGDTAKFDGTAFLGSPFCGSRSSGIDCRGRLRMRYSESVCFRTDRPAGQGGM